MKEGKYLMQPAYIKHRYIRYITGAVYDESCKLISDSQRHSSEIYVNDPPVLPIHLDNHFQAINSKSFIYYLGNHFSQYGHFILETLPMLSYLLHNQKPCFFNHIPFGTNSLIQSSQGHVHFRADLRLLKLFSQLLNLDIKRITINHEGIIPPPHNIYRTAIGKNYIGNFRVPPRPTVMEKNLIDPTPFDQILNRLIQNIGTKLPKDFAVKNTKKVFLSRKPKNYSVEKSQFVEGMAKSLGFTIVRPENFSIPDQIRLMQNAEVVMGFAGSQLHNVIFGRNLEKVIEIGRHKDPSVNPNQEICSEITRSKLIFCPLGSDAEIADILEKVFNNIVSSLALSILFCSLQICSSAFWI